MTLKSVELSVKLKSEMRLIRIDQLGRKALFQLPTGEEAWVKEGETLPVIMSFIHTAG